MVTVYRLEARSLQSARCEVWLPPVVILESNPLVRRLPVRERRHAGGGGAAAADEHAARGRRDGSEADRVRPATGLARGAEAAGAPPAHHFSRNITERVIAHHLVTTFAAQLQVESLSDQLRADLQAVHPCTR